VPTIRAGHIRFSIQRVKAAGIIASARRGAMAPALILAFERFTDPSLDKGCLAKRRCRAALGRQRTR
jgi:hypothetical protein